MTHRTPHVMPQLGVPIDCCDVDAAIDRIDHFVAESRRTGRQHQIVTVNADFLRMARLHEDVHSVLRTADLAVADGMPIVWASRRLGMPLPGRVTGYDLVDGIAALAATRRYRLLLLGGADRTASRSAQILRTRHFGLTVLALSGEIDESGGTSRELLDEIAAFDADIVCVALGHPKQERWISRHRTDLNLPVAIGVGGTFDFISGRRGRAPKIIRDSGLEWLYRLVQDPRRLSRRYVADLVEYVPSVALQISRVRRANRETGWRAPSIDDDRGSITVEIPADAVLDSAMLSDLSEVGRRAARLSEQPTLRTNSPTFLRQLHQSRLDRLFRIAPPTETPHAS